jgi:hypothetical protein
MARADVVPLLVALNQTIFMPGTIPFKKLSRSAFPEQRRDKHDRKEPP